MAATPQRTARPQDGFFLPHFCDVRMVFAVVVLGELLAMVLVLAPAASPSRWDDLSLVSLFVQWVGLTCAGVLCLARPWLRRLAEPWAAAAAYALILGDTALVSLGAEALSRALELPLAGPGGPARLWRHLGIAAVVGALALRYFYVQHQRKTMMQAEAQARIEALQARIRPHFLFNSLNTIASLIREQPATAEAAVEDLAELFRGTLAPAGALVPLSQELALARRYLSMEQLRLGERLAVRWNVAELPEDALLPPLTLQPLLENAVYHGIEPRAGGGTVGVDGHLYDDQVYLTVSNPLPAGGEDPRPGNRLAQENVRLRLQAVFGEGAGLTVHRDEKDYHLTLVFPLRTEAP